MAFDPSARARDLQSRLASFMERHIYPNEQRHVREQERHGAWGTLLLFDELKALARAEGLWNLFLQRGPGTEGLSNVDYAPLCEMMGRSSLAPEAFNCSAPDDGIMDLLVRYATAQQQRQWLAPLLAGEARACLAMTEPDVACSDATNVESSIMRDGAEYVINGRKWYISNGTDPRCRICVFMGRTGDGQADPYRQQSMVLVPMDSAGLEVVRALPVLGYYGRPDRPSEMIFRDVRVPADNIILGEGRGFEIAQGGLGPMRVHHCMREVGRADRALERLCRRVAERLAAGESSTDLGPHLQRIADGRILVNQARLLTLQAAHRMDTLGNKAARADIAMIKVAVPNIACQVIDWAIQAHGEIGLGDDFGLANDYAISRTLRIADGPDEVHRQQIARMELAKYQ